jgi:predicted nucleic-acid-binding Zn-ribbon protein
MKRTATCPKCEGKRVFRVDRVADAADWVGSGSGDLGARTGAATVPRRVLIRRTTSPGLFGGSSESYEPAGEVEAYACAECGYFEEYLREPAKIDWDRITGAHPHAAKPGSGGPFR